MTQTGVYTIIYEYGDAAGNTGSISRTVTVVELDTTPPVVTLSGSSSLTIAHGSVYVDD